jgi:hypothetical protein
MLAKKRQIKKIIALSITAFAIMACNLGVQSQNQAPPPQQGEGLPGTGATPEVNVTQEPPIIQETAAAPEAAVPTKEIGGLAELADDLRLAGAQVELGGKIEQPMLEKYDVDGQVIKVNGIDVQVFEFGNEFTRSLVSGRISDDGSSIAGQEIPLEDQPNFWGEGRIIVLYVGTDAAMINLLSSVLGEPITTHE